LPHPRFGFDDITRPNSDNVGDACDQDDDNDGLADADETSLGPGHSAHMKCPSASADTNPLVGDSDGDRALDAAECAVATDPMSAASKPAPAQCATAAGAPSILTNSDGDTFQDYIEFCYYNSDMHSANTDFDACGDAREIASVNNDQSVNSTDLSIVAASFGASTNPNYDADFDVNKDGSITSTDLSIVASKFGLCP
jgi:hypothetical protein